MLSWEVMGVLLVVNVVSEGGTNYQNRVTMKKTDVPAESMAQETQRYEEMRTSDDKETKYRAEIEKPQDFFREMYRVDLAELPELSEGKRSDILPRGEGLYFGNCFDGFLRTGISREFQPIILS